MAKRATDKPAPKAATTAAKAAAKAAAPAAIPAPNGPAQAQPKQGMTAPFPPEVLMRFPPVETPPGALGVLPPVAPLSEIVVTDPAGDAYAEGDIPPEIVVGVEVVSAADEPPASAPPQPHAMAPALAWLDELKAEQDAADAPKFDATHPAIALAQSFQSGSGVPSDGLPRYHLPEPPKLR